MTIEIKIPADALALQYHIGQALRNAAIDAGFVAAPDAVSVGYRIEHVDSGVTVPVEFESEKFTPPEAEFTAEQAKEVASDDTDPTEAEPITPDTPDADGIVWDKRIHSQGQTRNADGTWRLARKPKDKTEAEWNDYVEAVKAELLAVAAAENNAEARFHDPMSVDVETGEVFTDPVPPVTETVADPVPPVTETVADPVPPVTETVADPVPPVTETVADPVPPAPAADPVPPAPAADPVPPAPAADPVPPAPAADPVPPAPAADPVDEQLTFAKVIAFATANKSKLPPMDELNKVYADLAASMGIPVTTANAPIVAFAKAGPNVLSTLKATIEGLTHG